MERVIDSLNEISFTIPEGYTVSEDVYSLPNGQGMLNKENYVSDDGVISLFEIHRDPDEFFESYASLLKNFSSATQKFEVARRCQLRTGGFVFPTYVIKAKEQDFYTVQVFINCGDCLACFMVSFKEFDGTLKSAIKNDKNLKALVELLRTVQ